MNPLEVFQSLIGKEFSNSPSPFMRWLKPVVVSAEVGHLEFKYVVRQEWLNPMAILHGGITAGIIDDIIGATLISFNEINYYTTINNTIDYFSIAREGDIIIAETAIVKKGNQIVNVECIVWNEDKSRMIAKGQSNLMKIHPKK
ncbi:PaaI family thioesterase [Membranihabitans marinus]|uniref:PaaI family thioesterase n=1 Tax=Membranihabitans marinus TaxID=1227546 RepID=UPI001F2D6EF9|nr:PaaI family thioesterase [Membranihabitans marinus]